MRVGKTVVFDGKMGMLKFWSTSPPFGKVACAVNGRWAVWAIAIIAFLIAFIVML